MNKLNNDVPVLNRLPSVNADTQTDIERSCNCCNEMNCRSTCCFPFFSRRKHHHSHHEIRVTDEKINEFVTAEFSGSQIKRSGSYRSNHTHK